MIEYMLILKIVLGLLASGTLGLLGKDAVTLFKDLSKALEDGKITEDEIQILLNDVGRILKAVVRIFGLFRS